MMVIVLLCFNLALFFFGIYIILYLEEYFKKLEEYRKQTLQILEKVEELKNRLDNHNL